MIAITGIDDFDVMRGARDTGWSKVVAERV